MHPRILFAALLLALLPLAAGCGGEADGPAVFAALDTLPSPAADGSAEPNLSSGAEGRVYLSWIEPAGADSHAIRFAVLDGDQWSPPRTIATASDLFVNWADFPSLIELPDGRLAAHWLQRTGDAPYAYGVRIAQSSDGGATWSAPTVPHRDGTPQEHGFVALFPVGERLGAAWLDGRKYDASHGATREMQLAYATIHRDGSATAEQVVDARVCDCCQTAAAMTTAGPVVAYRDRSPGEIRDIALVRLVDGRWEAPRTVHEDGWHIEACPVNGPAIAAEDRRVAIAWFTAANDTARVLVAFSDDAGASFGEPVRVDDGKPAGRVGIVLDSDGSALVSWIERAGGDTALVRVRHVAAEGAAGAATTVAASTAARASGFPRIVRSGERVVLAWTVPGEPSRVRVARATLGGDS